MPSPFPGMDPFIESQDWRNFHTRMIVAIANELQPRLRSRYLLKVESTVYLATEYGEELRTYSPDVAVFEKNPSSSFYDSGVATLERPALLTMPDVAPIEEHYLLLRKLDDSKTVTVIELLSPTNKSLADGRAEYLGKRNGLAHSGTNIVEIDLLRGGRRLPTNESLPSGDYFAFVSRAANRPQVEVFSWPLERALPRIPIPLAEGDGDITLNLQSAFDKVYEEADLEFSLNYQRAAEPRLNAAQAQWVQACLTEQH